MSAMQTHARSRSEHGFSLIELLIAVGLLSVVLASLAQLFTLSVAANTAARIRTTQSLLAGQKLEQLRGLAFGFDVNGAPLTDMTTDTRDPTDADGGTGLSPGGSLDADVAGYADYADAYGSPTDPAHALYARRWLIASLPDDPDNTRLLQVLVTRRGGHAVDDVRAVAVRARKAR